MQSVLGHSTDSGNSMPASAVSVAASATMGSKRGRLLIRQSKIRKDVEQGSCPVTSAQSADLDTPEATVYSQCLLSVPRIERHASEPTPSHSSSGMSSPGLLAVPTSSLLIKQHSHPLLPSQSSHSPPLPAQSAGSFTLQRQLSHPLSSSSYASSSSHYVVPKSEPLDVSNPMVVIVSDTSSPSHKPSSTSQRLEELQRSISSPLVSPKRGSKWPTGVLNVCFFSFSQASTTSRDLLSLENTARSSHCPVVRPGPALGCNYCWNTIDAHGRILRRKTKYHCPECQTNLCIVPCFQKYHEEQNSGKPPSDSKPLRHVPRSTTM